MQGNYWVVQIEKNEEGEVYLKFCGYFPISAKQVTYIVTGVAAFGSAVSYIIHY